MRIFGREPALILGLVSAGVQMVTALFLPLTIVQVAAVNSIAAAGLGVWTAFVTRNRDGGASVKPAVLGFAQAAITLGLVFGVSLTDQQTAAIMAFVALAGALFVRQVSTPAGPAGSPPADPAAADTVPADTVPAGSVPAGTVPAGTGAGGAVPAGATSGGVTSGGGGPTIALPEPPPTDAAN
ncbi:hypothetical protein GCM10022419_049310 [Nonomuraea rosea]|uniref:Uncharacterized protein n=1 Tax=Nonomuraea rosea TaxID=638574 RepID=A0ABP6X8Q2_9ACTN